ncbi:MAG: bis(5'-nucleosyl)-tetraphosphatase (symmetrical) YqeK [Candidatus Izimaplasma sp.]|nr:bis(5'-nucleosyl)-tetraphosphatase (symmetrical) YqeK [Candidatus Izimaplasma bacterium]
MKEQIIQDLKELYQDKPDRLGHIFGVLEQAKKLGKKYDLDIKKIELIALLHDYTKYYSKKQNEKIIKEHYDNANYILKNYNENILHAFSAPIVIQEKYGITDDEILQAIMHHTVGKPNMSLLEKVIFISDYTEPNRSYESCKEVREILKESIDKAVYTAINDSINLFEEKNHHIPKIAYEARDYYKRKLEDSMDKLKMIIDNLDTLNLKDIYVYDMKDRSPFYDYFIISSATSNRQLNAATRNITKDLKDDDSKLTVEGKNSDSWVLIDTGDIIINVFKEENREYYNLEKMFIDIPKVNQKNL